MTKLKDSLTNSDNTAVGADNISTEMLQHIPEHCLQTVLFLFNKFWFTCEQAFREKFFQGLRRSRPGPQILLGPPSLIRPHAVKSFFVSAPNLRKILFSDFFPKISVEQKKRFSLKFSPNFCSKSGEELKKRSSLKFSLNFYPKLGEEQKISKNLTRKPELFRAPSGPP